MASCNYTFDLDSSTGNYYDLGTMITCILGNVWGLVRIILAGALIIMMSLLILKTIQNRENPKVLPELGKNWMYLLLAVIVAIGGAGTLLNILLPFFHLPPVQHWLDIANEFFGNL